MDNLEKFLENYRNKTINLITTSGNKGDGLIQRGIDYVFGKFNITIKRHYFIALFKSKVHFKEAWFNGCGGYCKNWTAPGILENCNKISDKLIVLPSTFDTSHQPTIDALKKLKSNAIVFCRDIISYKNVKYLNLPLEVYLSPDTAYYFLKNYKPKSKGKGIAYMFRNDFEQSNIAVPPENIPVSFGKPTQWKDILREIEKYEEIHTNYGHIGMTATMLGKKTFIYPGNYFKNKGFYEYTLKDYPNATFVTEDMLKDKKLLYLIKSRRSIRKWKNKPIKKKDLEDLIEAGIYAPSGCNTQNQRFIVITNSEDIDFIAKNRTSEVKKAKAIILYYSDNKSCVYNLKGKNSVLGNIPYYDCGACIQNILLLAHRKGLGACWFVMSDKMKNVPNINKKYKIASDLTIMGMIALGYPNEEVDYNKDLHQQRPIKRKLIKNYIIDWKE